MERTHLKLRVCMGCNWCVRRVQQACLRVVVMDASRVGRDEEMGEVEVPLRLLKDQVEWSVCDIEGGGLVVVSFRKHLRGW